MWLPVATRLTTQRYAQRPPLNSACFSTSSVATAPATHGHAHNPTQNSARLSTSSVATSPVKPSMATRPTQISCVLLKKRSCGGSPSRLALAMRLPRPTPDANLGASEPAVISSMVKTTLSGAAASWSTTERPDAASAATAAANAHIATRPFTLYMMGHTRHAPQTMSAAAQAELLGHRQPASERNTDARPKSPHHVQATLPLAQAAVSMLNVPAHSRQVGCILTGAELLNLFVQATQPCSLQQAV